MWWPTRREYFREPRWLAYEASGPSTLRFSRLDAVMLDSRSGERVKYGWITADWKLEVRPLRSDRVSVVSSYSLVAEVLPFS
jgi:hypothetical protein